MMALVAALLASISATIDGSGAGQPGRQIARMSAGLRAGVPVATLSIPRLHVDETARQGVQAPVLASGPGHYPSTALPGEPGTTAFAGHRVTHTHPFLNINLLRRGDVITVTTRWGRFRYKVYRERIVPPTDVAILRNVGYQQLVLTACHPPHTALKRYVVFARRIVTPAKAAKPRR
jgi:sortase A